MNIIANDKPLLIGYRGALYAPLLQTIPGTKFGLGFLPTEADFKDPAVREAISRSGWMIWPPIPFNAETIVTDAGPAPAAPTWHHWLGTDDESHDVLARTLYGLRGSLIFALVLTLITSSVGLVTGALQGFYGGLIDLVLQRLTEIWSGIPVFFLLIVLSGLFALNFIGLLLFLALFNWMFLSNLVRAEFLRARQLDYVLAARAIGLRDWQIMALHILPNAMLALISYVPFLVAEFITLLAGLEFLGVGLPPGAASLGSLLAQAQNNPDAPWLSGTAFVALGGIILLLVLLGENLRDHFAERQIFHER